MSGLSAHGNSGSGPAGVVRRAPMLRPYQAEAISAVKRELATLRSTLYVAATGTGKTVTFAELARSEVSHGGRVLILVHRDELIKQAQRKCEDIGLWPEVEKGKQRASTKAKIVLASVQSMRGERLLRWARDHFTLVIVDEAHHATASGYRAVLDHFADAKVIGVTATPDRADGVGLSEVFASVAYRYDIQQAIADGYLVPIVARRIVVDSIDLTDIDGQEDFVQSQLSAVMLAEKAVRGIAVPLLELARERPTIVFCVDVAHAAKMAEVLNTMRAGCARTVSGKTSDEERERILEDFTRGRFQFLTNCDVLTEGFDAPACSCVAMCRPTKSRGRYVQGAGRGLRLLGVTYAESVANGKRDCLLLQFSDATSRLIGPADCLTGDAGDIPDDLREELDRRITGRQVEIGPLLAQATHDIEQQRIARRFAAVVKYHAEHVDPFIGPPNPDDVPPCDAAWEQQPASRAQLDWLERDDVGVTVDKLPAAFSRADAWRLIARIKARKRHGLCSYKMAKKLTALGIVNAAQLSAERAGELRMLCVQYGWKTSSLVGQPELGPRKRGVA